MSAPMRPRPRKTKPPLEALLEEVRELRRDLTRWREAASADLHQAVDTLGLEVRGTEPRPCEAGCMPVRRAVCRVTWGQGATAYHMCVLCRDRELGRLASQGVAYVVSSL